jgi:hypothetical protein
MNLIRRSLIAASMVAVCTLSAPALHASIFHPVHAALAKVSIVKLSLRNDSAADIQLRAGDDTMTLAPGKTLAIKLPAGTRITAAADTSAHRAGDLVVEVASALNGATVAIH